MSMNDMFFTNDDKPFAENFNDGLLIANTLDMTVPVELPAFYRNNVWSNVSSPRKAGVSIVTLKEGLPSGVRVDTDPLTGKSILTGTGTVRIWFYPNWNSFGQYSRINWEEADEGTVNVNLCNKNGGEIIHHISKGDITSQSSDLRVLDEILVEIEMTDAVLYNFELVMKTTDSERYGASVSIDNVTGLNERLDSIDALDTLQNGRLSNLEGSACNIYYLRLLDHKGSVLIDSETVYRVQVLDKDKEPVQGSSVVLYENGENRTHAQTDSEGIAYLTISNTRWGVKNYEARILGKEYICLNWSVCVEGWRPLYTSDTYAVYRNGTHGRLVLNRWQGLRVEYGNWVMFGGTGYALEACPASESIHAGANLTFWRISPEGYIYYTTVNPNKVTPASTYSMEIEWLIDPNLTQE